MTEPEALPQSTRLNEPYSVHHPVQTVERFQQRRDEASQPAAQAGSGPAPDVAPRAAAETPAPETENRSTSRAGSGNDQRSGKIEDVPISGETTNVLFHPPPDINVDRAFGIVLKQATPICVMVAGAIVFLDFLFIGGGFRGLFLSLVPALGVSAALFYVLKSVNHGGGSSVEKSSPESEKLRYMPESVEWMNTLVDTIWHAIDKDVFKPVDNAIKPFVPTDAVKVSIAEIGQGSNALRVLSMRSLPDDEFGDMVPTHGTDKDVTPEEKAAREKAVETEEGGTFYNLEVSVAYHAAPLTSPKQHLHCDIHVGVGGFVLPIYVVVKEFVATLRLRLQMHSFLPFLKNVTFALTEPPKVHSSVSLGAPWTLNLLNLPLLDNFIQSQIVAAASAFVQPKSMGLDMTIYLGGSDLKSETDAIGLLFVRIHSAWDLARQDARGPGADPYLTIAFSKYEKPMFATRIIKGTLNPVWEESAFILIKAEHVKRHENVLLKLWDSDMSSADDVCGQVEFPLLDLMMNANNMVSREDALQTEIGSEGQGVLKWEIGYFPRAGYKKSLRTDEQDARDVHGDKIKVEEKDKTQDALNTAPDSDKPSGILSLTINQLIGVEIENPNQKHLGQIEARKENSSGEEDEEETQNIGYLPSLYCTAHLNDELIYRTRTKSINSSPIYNSSIEHYIRDWRLAILTVAAWDVRRKERDALVGVAVLKLGDVLTKSSAVVKILSLKGGQGDGRLRVSLLFRSVDPKLEKPLLGFGIGTWKFTSPLTVTGDVAASKLKIKTGGSRRVVKNVTKTESGNVWKLEGSDARLPVHYRHSSALVLEFSSKGLPGNIGGGISKKSFYAVLWLHKIADNETLDYKLPVRSTNNPSALVQNVVDKSDPSLKLGTVGEVKFSGVFSAGMDDDHEEFLDTEDQRDTYEVYQASVKAGLRGEEVRRSDKTIEMPK